MSKTETFTPNNAAAANSADYDALKLTDVEYHKLLSGAHLGDTISVAQADRSRQST